MDIVTRLRKDAEDERGYTKASLLLAADEIERLRGVGFTVKDVLTAWVTKELTYEVFEKKTDEEVAQSVIDFCHARGIHLTLHRIED